MVCSVARLSRSRIVLMMACLALGSVPHAASARVTPLRVIEQQILKPNMLILLDTSRSMYMLPGEKDIEAYEAGIDCDNGDAKCRLANYPSRCFFNGTGKNGTGVGNDTTTCSSDAHCRTGKCKSGGATCTVDADCSGSNNPCTTRADDYCVSSSAVPSTIMMCQQSMARCITNAQCPLPGDSCGPASSRLVVAKRVLSKVVNSYYSMVNFGLMTLAQFEAGPAKTYYPYYPISGSTSTSTKTTFLSQGRLESASCFTRAAGPAATCTIGGTLYTRQASTNSRYRLHVGDHDDFAYVDANWCGFHCKLTTTTPAHNALFQGSYYTYSVTDGAPNLSGTVKVLDDYMGQTTVVSGVTYAYWDAPATVRNYNGVYLHDFYNTAVGKAQEPISGETTCDATNCGNGCSGRWDLKMAPFMDTTNDATKAKAMAAWITARMEKASNGGFSAAGITPTGCALNSPSASSLSAPETVSAYHYMQKVKAADTLPCRNNTILLVTDGQPTGPGDTSCDASSCAAANPISAGCPCRAVKNAYTLSSTLGVKVYVVGFSEAVRRQYALDTMNNIARAGGTTQAYFAVQEDELFSAIVKAIYSAASGSYSSSPSTASASTQTSTGVDSGKLLLDSRVDFPSWKGNLIAYNMAVTPPVVAWNAANVAFNASADPGFWKKRNVWTSETVGGLTTMVKVDVDPSTGNLVNAAKLTSLGLGANDTETTRVVKWMLGDPAMGNPAVLGALVNSTPTDIGPPGESPLPGGSTFFNSAQMKARPYLTYVGSSDGMLHAFFSRNVTIGGTPYLAGQEAFAYIPQDMLPTINKLYVQGGQLPDPKDHIFGLASSPKVTNVCSAGCNDASTATWKTVLVMTEGYGGRDSFMLDITEPHTTNGIRSGVTDPPVKLLWNTEYLADATDKGYFDTRMGQTISVPAFYLGKTASLDDYRMISTSGYSDGVSTTQGKYLVSASTATGVSIDWDTPTPPVTCSNPGLDYAMLTDVATAKNLAATEKGQISAAYFGDTWGNLWRYVPALSASCTNCTSTTGTVSLVNANGCGNPLHFAPTVVQLDQKDPSNHPGEIYLVEATNSSLDAVTGVVNASYPASRLVFRKEVAVAGVVSAGTFADGSSELVKSSAVSTEVCAVTNATGTTCTTAMPAGARPTATPLAVLRADGTGFQVLTVWYVPVSSGCDVGTSYLTIHELLVTGGVTQKYGRSLGTEPVTGMAFVNGKLVFSSSTGVVDVTALLPTGAPSYGSSSGGAPTAGKFKRTAWTEMP
jgi:hypothetical protein